MPKQTKIVIAVIISSYSFLILLSVCQFGRCLSVFSHSALRSIFLDRISAFMSDHLCRRTSGASGQHSGFLQTHQIGFSQIPAISAYSKGQIFHIVKCQYLTCDLGFLITDSLQSRTGMLPDGVRLTKVLGLTETVLPEVTQHQPNLFSHCK